MHNTHYIITNATDAESAESQGTVWTLQEFVAQFNDGEEPLCGLLADVNGDVVMKSALFEDNTFVTEIRKSIVRGN